MAFKKHVHCYDAWPGNPVACLTARLEPDGEVLHEGVRYKPVLVFDRTDCLVIARDSVRAFVVTPADGADSPSEGKARELVGAGAGVRVYTEGWMTDADLA